MTSIHALAFDSALGTYHLQIRCKFFSSPTYIKSTLLMLQKWTSNARQQNGIVKRIKLKATIAMTIIMMTGWLWGCWRYYRNIGNNYHCSEETSSVAMVTSINMFLNASFIHTYICRTYIKLTFLPSQASEILIVLKVLKRKQNNLSHYLLPLPSIVLSINCMHMEVVKHFRN